MDVEQLARDFARNCAVVQTQLRDMGAKVLPNAVANPLHSASFRRVWCRRRRINADRLVGGAPSTHGVHEAPPVPERSG